MNVPKTFAIPLPLFLLTLLTVGLSKTVPVRSQESATTLTETEVLFLRTVKPIFKTRCWGCHGEQEDLFSDLDLTTRESMLRGGLAGPAIIPGNAGESLLVQAVSGTSDEIFMPLQPDNKPLREEEVAAIRQWVEGGAPWPEESALRHWAYIPPVKTERPAVQRPDWPRNTIDYFILARLEAEDLIPAPEADRATLLRRVSFDLTGLPPTIAEIDLFLADQRPDAWHNVVDRLLASPRFGERWAQRWLDLARYSDSNGYQHDRYRDIWKYRDWVIQAFNDDLPFDRFTIEQLAGDLLPDATISQRIATGFHRNTMMNNEGGIDPEEYRVADVVDRTNTTATVWLGTTLACAQCHDHKFDPISQKDYYRVFAFFNSTADSGSHSTRSEVKLEMPTPEETIQRDQHAATVKRLQEIIDAATPELAAARRSWETQIRSGALPDSTLPKDVLTALMTVDSQRTPEQETQLAKYYRRVDPALKPVNEALAKLKKNPAKITSALVMEELAILRPTHVLLRGNFLTPGAAVSPGVPAVLPPLPEGEPPNRLGFARWLVSRANPLTARVTVNRFWEDLFGTGIVSTGEDFGTRGEPPSHPALLDWLAVEFMDNGWSVKQLLRLYVTSAAYRQSSKQTPALTERDPANRLLARGPRFRLEAEMIRDNALAIAGLLNGEIGGPSVYPHQPGGIWNVTYALDDKWKVSPGDDRWRRGLYTFIKRTAPYPAFMIFDMKSREACSVRRSRTNTPLQALATLNDPVFMHAAAGLALRMLTEAEGTVADRVAYGFRLCLARGTTTRERQRLADLYEENLQRYRADAAAADAMLSHVPDKWKTAITEHNIEPAIIAAWTVVANVMLNLDAVLTKS